MKIRAGLFAAFILASASSFAVTNGELESWIEKSRDQSLQLLLKNIHPDGTAAGVVVASPSKVNPDYWYHWTRDAALVMNVIVDLYSRSVTPTQRGAYEKLLLEFIDFSRKNQQTSTPSGGPGEPKFNVDGSAFTGPWGRPQNDGPALRSIALIRLAKMWLAEGKDDLVREKLYEAEIPAQRVLKADLEFVSHHWQEKCFDLWEEVRGDHFYTRMVQRRALIEGAQLAALLGDGGAADWYAKQAKAIEPTILKHWDASKGYLVATLNRDAGADYKGSNLDSAIVLGVLHSGGNDFLPVTDEKVLATARALERSFTDLYPINQKGLPGVAIGRYPEDRYDGTGTDQYGNAWVLLTAGFAELYHSAATRFEKKGEIEITRANYDFFRALNLKTLDVGKKFHTGEKTFMQLVKAMRSKGDEFLSRVRYHGPDGRFAEQMNRWTGFMQGAKDLTWSYAAFLTALDQRSR